MLRTRICYACRWASDVGVCIDSSGRDGLDLIEFNTHSFIVKIWLEEPAEDLHKGRWRGHITHVPSGERRYLQSLGEIVAFIVPYLVSMGVRLDVYWRLRSWLGKGLRIRAAPPESGNEGRGGHERVPAQASSRGGPPVER